MRVIIVEDEDILRISIRDNLVDAGMRVTISKFPSQALNYLKYEKFDIALVDYKLPEMNGVELLKRIMMLQPECEVIIMTAFGTIQTAVTAMKLGAFDYITKPFSNDELLLILRRIAEIKSLKQENIELKEQLKERHSYHKLIGKSKSMQQIYDLLATVADSNSSVLITGETGTGKEMVADAIHYMGARQDNPYIKVSCAMFSKDVLESELFGHEMGAFTGAVHEKKGRFELADTGTLFLDDVDDIPMDLQVKLLRVLQHGEFERVGGTKTIRPDVRFIAASKANLLEKSKKGEFREDLYYRLNVIQVYLPPLRERKEDIPLLIDSFLDRYPSGKTLKILNPALNCLLDYNWPGNVRELENLIERLSLIMPGRSISCSHLPSDITYREDYSKDQSLEGDSFIKKIAYYEYKLIKQALDKTGGNKAKAARILNIKLSTLRSKIEKFNL